MRFHCTGHVLMVISALVAPSQTLPLEHEGSRRGPPQFLAPRATYSVVPINGAIGSGNSVGSTSTGAVTSTRLAGPLPSPTTVSIVNIEPSTSTRAVHAQPTTTSTAATGSTTIGSQATSLSSPLSTPLPPTPAPTTPPSAAGLARTTVATTSLPPATTTAPPALSTSSTFDDGMWHTTYPPWTGTKLARRISRPRRW
ncbi:hypothetical protein B0T18DRAFT_155230 [Schizothecium vesticola]|uniref:Uncharacterized protein n=1 Tax=Schizothecium vesticola TaxID=314040 RepID=A0AA40EWB3_9PEZI|nr:hypothetical protein B0T18DRAFT_155230 [Schizothecium vesticola]